ncbi:Endonuclease of RecB family [Hyperthermus butylicus DSM 5456]|uniref:Endonuclease of RecB family n=2 Tax=Hyperthermus butylicus TaxID=54248 RepID=A2BIV6_HYPBU|nr:Endonuclease of RecB family [Hyperthermus butylicus DSM 5456]
MSGMKRWHASERIAFRLLEEQGYEILEVHKRVRIEGVEVAEVDAVARGPDGELYAVEVKAGRLDVHGVRQAYSNAILLNAKPLVICKGFADEAAEKLAEKLGVKVIALEDVFLVDSEELEDLVYHAVYDAVAEVVRLLFSEEVRVKPELLPYLRAIALKPTIQEAASYLSKPLSDVVRVVEFLRRLSPLARRGYRYVRLTASILLLRLRVAALLESFESTATRLEKLLEGVGAPR